MSSPDAVPKPGGAPDPTGFEFGDPAAFPGAVTVEFTDDGYLRMGAEVAAAYFPNDAMVAVPRDGELWLMPLIGPEGGGLLLKQRNLRGDRSALIWEALPADSPIGQRPARWDPDNGALRVELTR